MLDVKVIRNALCKEHKHKYKKLDSSTQIFITNVFKHRQNIFITNMNYNSISTTFIIFLLYLVTMELFL